MISASQEAQPQSFPKAQNNNNEISTETFKKNVSKTIYYHGVDNNRTTIIDSVIITGNGKDTTGFRHSNDLKKMGF